MVSYLVGHLVVDDKPYFLCHISISAMGSHILEKSAIYYIYYISYTLECRWFIDLKKIAWEWGRCHFWTLPLTRSHVFILIESGQTQHGPSNHAYVETNYIRVQVSQQCIYDHHHEMFNDAETFPGKWKLSEDYIVEKGMFQVIKCINSSSKKKKKFFLRKKEFEWPLRNE